MNRRLSFFLRGAMHDLLLGLCFIALLVLASLIYLAFHRVRAETAPIITRPAVVGANSKEFGIAFGDTLRWQPQKTLDSQLRDVSSIGFKWIRIDIDWSEVQPDNKATFKWADYDRVTESARAHNLHVLATIAYAPKWARQAECKSDSKCAPADLQQYADFAKATAAHYSLKGVNKWEIWNEPNIAFWKPAPNVGRYTAMLKLAYASIKSADPSAGVISAGLAPAVDGLNGDISPRTFLKGMYANGAKSSFDALGYHPYSYPAPPNAQYSWSGWAQMGDLTTSLRSIMVANGDSYKRIWMTEFGAATNGPGPTPTSVTYPDYLTANHVDEQLQSQMVQEAYAATASYNWAGPLFWYSYKDLSSDTADKENFFGLLRADGSKKPAYDIFKKLLQK